MAAAHAAAAVPPELTIAGEAGRRRPRAGPPASCPGDPPTGTINAAGHYMTVNEALEMFERHGCHGGQMDFFSFCKIKHEMQV